MPVFPAPWPGYGALSGVYLQIANNLSDVANAVTARDNLGVEIGVDVQAFDATLLSIAALGTAADRIAYTTAVDTWAETTLTAFGRTLIDDVDAATARTTLGLVAGGAGDIWVEKAGDTMTGDLISRNVYPSADDTYTLGISGTGWAEAYMANGSHIYFGGVLSSIYGTSTSIIINNDQNDVDFNVESLGDAILFHIDGGSDFVSIGSHAQFITGTKLSLTAGSFVHRGTDLSSASHYFERYSANSFASNRFHRKSRNGTLGSHTIVQSADTLGLDRYYGSDGAAFIEAASIGVNVDGTPGTNDMPGRIVFSTTADGASSPTERLRISQDGNMLFASGSSFTLPDSALGQFGTSNDAKFAWDTTDANANMFKLDLPTGGAVDVPVLGIGIGNIGVDRALLNGTTAPTLMMFSTDGASGGYLYHDNTNFVITNTEGQINLVPTSGIVAMPGSTGAGNPRFLLRAGSGLQAGFELGESTASLFFMRHMGNFDEAILCVTSNNGRQVLLIESDNRDRDHDIPVMNDPLFCVFSVLNVTTDHSEAATLHYRGLRAGYVSNADWVSSTFAMETDRATYSFTVGSVNAFVSAANTTNKNGSDLYIRSGNGNTAHTVAADGGDIKAVPGKNDTGGGGVDGVFEVWHPDEGANDTTILKHDATDGFIDTGSGDLKLASGGTTVASVESTAGILMVTKRLQDAQGADVAAANDLTLGTDGNCFEITGATQINAITTTNWQNGAIITLLFASTPTVKHNTAGGAGTAVILLAGAADFAATAGDTLTLRLCEIGGTQAWREMARTVI